MGEEEKPPTAVVKFWISGEKLTSDSSLWKRTRRRRITSTLLNPNRKRRKAVFSERVKPSLSIKLYNTARYCWRPNYPIVLLQSFSFRDLFKSSLTDSISPHLHWTQSFTSNCRYFSNKRVSFNELRQG